MASHSFHPAVERWFVRRFGTPTEPQARGWPSIQAGEHTLIAAPTGSGKTLAAFLAAIDALVREGLAGELPGATQVVYVSPLKALSNDIERNLQEPLAEIARELREMGLPPVEIRAAVRTGDTPSTQRAAATRRPPHLFVTTPESLYILLTSEGGRRLLGTARTVIVDEIHALVGSKRGSHLALSLERLDALAGRPLTRVGLSATQRPIDEVARFLTGDRPCAIVDTGHRRDLDLALELPRSPLDHVMAGEVWDEVYDRLAELIGAHRTTLVFVNTRRLAERVAARLSDRLGAEAVCSHHGSMSREKRLAAEQRLKHGDLRALVATASLELGIDVGAIDLVCQVGATRSIAAFLQRVGRSGHSLGGLPKGRLFPLSIDELVESAALLRAIRQGDLDRLSVPEAPLDILAQQIVAAVACEEWEEDALYALVRRAYPYRALPRADFDAVVRMLADGFTTRRGRRGAYVHRDLVHGRLRGRRGARLSAVTSGGAIPDNADYEVILEPTATRIGTVNEDFAIESMAGDIFQLGNASWRILRVEPGRVRVEDARGQPPTIPFWLGEAPARTPELSRALSDLRVEVQERLPDGAARWLSEEIGLPHEAAEPIASYLRAAHAVLGALPTHDTLVLERFFDESGGMQLVLHSPFGSRVNRALGLALRKRFCQRFNFELQAAATENAIVLSLGPTHSFPLADVFGYLRVATVREVLVQALLVAPMFEVRWRWNASRALAVPRRRGGRAVPPRLQRMQAADLLALVFPDQVACAENLAGPREVPDHPIVAQTVRDCLEEAMDIAAVEALLGSIERGEKRLVARELSEPSPLALEVLSARPYAFLDDAPLEERRTQAVMSRRWLDAAGASGIGALDADAIARVRDEVRPRVETPDELHDALTLLGFFTEEEGRGFEALLADLVAAGRATRVRVEGSGVTLWVAADRLPEVRAVLPNARLGPPLRLPAVLASKRFDEDEALVELVRSRLEGLGPTTAREIAATLSLPGQAVEVALARLESQGFVFRGRFTPGAPDEEWCERRLLARIHQHTLTRLRREIEPVSASDFLSFLFAWQRVRPESRGVGPDALLSVLEQLDGFEAPAAAWESEILPARIEGYDPAWLDALCLSGRVAWARTSPRETRTLGPVRATPIALLSRRHLGAWLAAAGAGEAGLSEEARAVHRHLAAHGASFFAEVMEGTGLLRAQAEAALAELVAAGLVTADGFAGLRALLLPAERRRALRRSRRAAASGMESAGRWSLLRREPSARALCADDPETETIARALLGRYGVVFRRVLEREALVPAWREIVRCCRRLEARGEIRGGRFVAGFTGEQYALPEAVSALRATRREPDRAEIVSVSAADPLNLVGLVTPGARIPSLARNRVVYRGGVPVAAREGGEVRWLAELDPAAASQAAGALAARRAR